MTSTEDNLLARAIANDEIDQFLVGEPPYFFETRGENEEPQNVSQVFDSCVLHYWRQTKDDSFPAKIFSALANVLNTYPDRNRAIYVAHDWIWYYLYCLNKKKTQPSGYYGDLFDIDLTSLASLLKVMLETNKDSLSADKRWAGASWNSKNGMWDALLRISEAVKDKLGGPDFIPANK